MASKPGTELWAIRIPADVNLSRPNHVAKMTRSSFQLKPSRLSGLSITLPSHNERRSHPSGSLQTKSQRYTLVSAGSGKRTHEVVDDEGRRPTAGPGLVDAMTMDFDAEEEVLRVEGGEEMRSGMRLLVPRVKMGGKLFLGKPPPFIMFIALTL